jgi:Sensor protein PilS (EC 2.7.3.-)
LKAIPTTPTHNLQILQIYLYYRLILGAVLWLTYTSGVAASVLGKLQPDLFNFAASGYCLISFGSLFVFRAKQLTHSIKRISFLLIIDIIALLLMIHASGGIDSGLGYLLLINVAIASIFIRGQLAFAFAAMVSLFVIGDSFYLPNTHDSLTSALFSAGSLGVLIFITSISFHYLTEKIRISDIEAASQARYAEHLQRLAQHIITRMRTGIVVIDEKNRIELLNQSAMQLLGLPQENYIGHSIAEISNLETLVNTWHKNPVVGIPKQHLLRAGQEARVSFALLETEGQERTILYMEDYRSLAQHAQQLKLASLGRLTASIAHEVRNPLGAISHASQLLKESEHLHPSDSRLMEIILQHSDRVNQIIENTLVLSSRKEPKAQQIDLNRWLPRFISEYDASNASEIQLHPISEHLSAKFDPVHLTQILTNLCDNGLRFSLRQTGKAQIEIRAGISENDDTPFIEVIDNGPGVSDEMLSQIFDPFYTTDEKGSGLGLYISRELCEINQASIFFQRTPQGKSCFRINCPHHQRMI